jgi:DNA-binding PadR family transcriptional regulator
MYSGRDKKSKKGRFSSEYTMLSILEYLYVNSRKNAVSKYNIVTNTPGIRQQRADRVSIMMDSLEKNGYIISEHTSSNITFYKITQKGIDEYEKWIKNFLDFARNTNIGGGSITNELSDDDSNRSIVL